VEERVVLPPRLFVQWRLVVARWEFIRWRIIEGEVARLIRSEGVRKRAACKWTNHGQRPPPSLLPPMGVWAISSSLRWRAWSPSFEDDIDWEGLEAEAESTPAPV
jgi:hypothetical protein